MREIDKEQTTLHLLLELCLLLLAFGLRPLYLLAHELIHDLASTHFGLGDLEDEMSQRTAAHSISMTLLGGRGLRSTFLVLEVATR